MTDDQKPLDDDQRERLAKRLTDLQLNETPRVDKPLAVFTAGQPGSGKSGIVRTMRVQFGDARAVEINPDDVRPAIPYMGERIQRGELKTPDAANMDAGIISHRMMQMAGQAQRNIIYDGTLSNSFYAGQNIDELKKLGYRVEVHSMATSPELSHARTYSRREQEIKESDTRFGRGVDDSYHDQSLKGLLRSLDDLQAGNKPHALVAYDQNNKVIGVINRENDQWVPDKRISDMLREVHNNPTKEALQGAAQQWDLAANLMRERGADPAEQQKVDRFRESAFDRLGTQPTIDPATQAKAQPDADRSDKGERLVIGDGSRVHEKRIDGTWRETDAEPQGNSPNGVYRLDKARDADPKSKDEYRGAVLHVDKANVYQLGSDSQVVRHDRDRFKETPNVGEGARIGYDSGRAVMLNRSAEPSPNRGSPAPSAPARTPPDRER